MVFSVEVKPVLFLRQIEVYWNGMPGHWLQCVVDPLFVDIIKFDFSYTSRIMIPTGRVHSAVFERLPLHSKNGMVVQDVNPQQYPDSTVGHL